MTHPVEVESPYRGIPFRFVPGSWVLIVTLLLEVCRFSRDLRTSSYLSDDPDRICPSAWSVSERQNVLPEA